MFARSHAQQDGFWNAALPIVNGATVNVQPGCATNVHPAADCRNFPFMRFGAFFDQPVRLDVLGAWDGVTFFIVESLNLLANTYGSVYNFPAPRNADGLYVLQWPFFEFNITNTGAAPTTIQECYWWIQNYRA